MRVVLLYKQGLYFTCLNTHIDQSLLYKIVYLNYMLHLLLRMASLELAFTIRHPTFSLQNFLI